MRPVRLNSVPSVGHRELIVLEWHGKHRLVPAGWTTVLGDCMLSQACGTMAAPHRAATSISYTPFAIRQIVPPASLHQADEPTVRALVTCAPAAGLLRPGRTRSHVNSPTSLECVTEGNAPRHCAGTVVTQEPQFCIAAVGRTDGVDPRLRREEM